MPTRGEPDWAHAASVCVPGTASSELGERGPRRSRAGRHLPDPASRSGRGVRTIGWSYSAGRLLTVITLVDADRLLGVNGCVANTGDQRLYREEDRDG